MSVIETYICSQDGSVLMVIENIISMKKARVQSENLTTRERCMEYIKHPLSKLEFIPEKLKTFNMCLEAVKRDGTQVQYTPKHILKAKNHEICFEALKQCSYALKYIPEELRTLELCSEAIKNSRGHALQYVPEEIKTYEFCFEALRQAETAIWCAYIMNYVPEKYKNKKLYDHLLIKDIFLKIDEWIHGII